MSGIDCPNESSDIHPRAPLYERPTGKASPARPNMNDVTMWEGRERMGTCSEIDSAGTAPPPIEYPGKRRLRSGTVQLTAEESVVPIIVVLVQKVF
jgi:hypothetical protein